MWFLFAIAAQFISGSSAVIDKLLLKKSYPNPIGYTFWIGVLSIFTVFLAPFGFRVLNFSEFSIAFLTGAVSILALFFYFAALFYGEASSSIILIWALAPIFTLIFSSALLNINLTFYQFISFTILILGGLILFFIEQKKIRLKVIALAILAAFCFGLASNLTKMVFNFSDFFTGLIWIKIASFLTVLIFLAIPSFRKKIFHPEGRDEFKNKWAYLFNRAYAGLGSILIYASLSMGLPPLVDSTRNIQYLFIFLGGWLILRERFRGWILIGKITAFAIISLGILWLAAGEYYNSNAWLNAGWAPEKDRPIIWGITFSQKFSEKLGLDWKENYEAILNELKPEKLRLIAYWDKVQPAEDEFDFSDLDYQMDQVEKAGAKVILAVGRKLPRWPECHYPDWIKSNQEFSISNSQFSRTELLSYIREVVERYRNHEALEYWQVENEPFLKFGECPALDRKFLNEEIALVKSLDPSHPILITDSGELGLWYSATKKGDTFGATMYRMVYNDLFGFVDYHLPPEFFRIKEKVARFLTGEHDKKFIVIELALEPWLPKQLYETTLEEQLEHFDLDFFKNTIEYAKAADFDEYYLWGAEWWFWLKVKQGHPEFWDFSKTLFTQI